MKLSVARHHVRLTLLTAGVALALVTLPTYFQRQEPLTAAGGPVPTAHCRPFTPPHDLAGLNRIVRRYRSTPGFVGADVGADVLLQRGRRLWVFGDTLRRKSFDGQRFVRNSMLLFSRHCVAVVLPADGGAIIPDRLDQVGYWPMSIAKISFPGYDLVGIGAQRVQTTGDGAFDFRALGPAIAVFMVPVGGAPQLLQVKDLGPDSSRTDRPMWGAAVVIHDGWVYVYGTRAPTERLTFGFSMYVARTRVPTLTDPKHWQYWDGARWQPDSRRLGTLIPNQGGVSQTLSVFERAGWWYAVSKRDEFLGHDLVIWKAPGPTGPFVAGPPVAQIPSHESGVLRYMPLAHPDLLPRPGHVIVSVSQNTARPGVLARHPHLYRPRFLEVALP